MKLYKYSLLLVAISLIACNITPLPSEDEEIRESDTHHLFPIFVEKFPGNFRDSIETSYLFSEQQIAENIENTLFPGLDSLVFDTRIIVRKSNKLIEKTLKETSWASYKVIKLSSSTTVSSKKSNGTNYYQKFWEVNFQHFDKKFKYATLVEFLITYKDMTVQVEFLLTNKAKTQDLKI